MQIIHYPHPTLRRVSKPVQRIDAELRRTVAEMFETMYQANGVGLAANQVDLPVRLFVFNPAADPNEGEELACINPVLSQPKGKAEEEEGCLSLPGIVGAVRRPEKIRIQAYDLAGNPIDRLLDSLTSRIVQHEVDHLDGILFIDRLSDTGRAGLEGGLEELELEYQNLRRLGQLPPDDEIHARWASVEAHYCRA